MQKNVLVFICVTVFIYLCTKIFYNSMNAPHIKALIKILKLSMKSYVVAFCYFDLPSQRHCVNNLGSTQVPDATYQCSKPSVKVKWHQRRFNFFSIFWHIMIDQSHTPSYTCVGNWIYQLLGQLSNLSMKTYTPAFAVEKIVNPRSSFEYWWLFWRAQCCISSFKAICSLSFWFRRWFFKLFNTMVVMVISVMWPGRFELILFPSTPGNSICFFSSPEPKAPEELIV